VRILALDMATATGWATNKFGGMESGVQRFDVKRGESVGMRWLRFNAWLQEMWSPRWSVTVAAGSLPVENRDEQAIQLIVYEQNFLRGQAPTEIAMGFSTRVHEFCARQTEKGYTIEHVPVGNQDLKFWMTGKRKKVEKIDMFNAALAKGWLAGIPQDPTAKLPKTPIDDNQVDAICLLKYAESEIARGQ
jgi:hypothetical protein